MHEFLTSTSQESWGAGGRGEKALCDLHVSTVFQRALASIIERKIMLMSDACSRPPICIRSHNLHVDNIKGTVGEITSYHMRGITSLPFFFFVSTGCSSFDLSLAFRCCLPCDGSGHQYFIHLFSCLP